MKHSGARCQQQQLHICHSVGLCAKQGRGDKATKATVSPTSHDLTACLRNFPLASRSGASGGDMCLGVCVCVRAGCAGMYFHVYTCLCLYRVSHLWYIYTATWRDTKANIYLRSTHFYQSQQDRICLCAYICIFNGVNVRILCQYVSPCSPHRHARRSGSLKPCQSICGTPGWGGWRSLLGPVWLHTPLKTDWRLGSTCLHTTEQGGDNRKWCHWTIIWMNSMQTVTSTL